MVEEDAVKEEAKPETESAVEVTKTSEEPSAAVGEKEPVAELNVRKKNNFCNIFSSINICLKFVDYKCG